MLKAAFVTSLPPDLKSGGWSGMNVNLYGKLSKHFKVDYIGPIYPIVSKTNKIVSKLKSTLGFKRDFEFYAESRLLEIKKSVLSQIGDHYDFMFFHGTTPWIKCYIKKPYFAYIDATFLTYLDIYLQGQVFSHFEIQRIFEQEKTFLANASAIFFSSQWALNETVARYEMPGTNFVNVGLGGNTTIPSYNTEKEGKNLLFVSMDFKRKGGFIAFEAYCKLKSTFPKLKLNIVGDRPSDAIINDAGVVYHGFIDKKTIEGQKRFETIFNDSCLLIHPTEKDMTPLIVIEAGYYGIPTIAPRRFGIPEMIIDGQTGFLLNENNSQEICSKISNMLKDTQLLNKMRSAVFEYTTNSFNWEKVGINISNTINATIA
jgi:glycosyltransferase involved in cell wall biosynthesis